jgi:hypothetical protein
MTTFNEEQKPESIQKHNRDYRNSLLDHIVKKLEEEKYGQLNRAINIINSYKLI